jgi:hypothetical protein
MGKQTKADFASNLIILRSVYGKVGQKYYIQPCKDKKTGRLPECVKPVNSQGDIILSDKERNSGEYFIRENETFVVEDGTVFDLSDEIQRKNWEAIRNCSLIAPDFNAKDSDGNYLIHGTANMKTLRPRYGVAELFIDQPGLDSYNRISKKKKIHNACAYILDDPRGSEGRLLMAKLLGKNMSNMPDADVEDYLLTVAEKDPDKIVKLYTGDDLALRLLFIEAREKKIILVKNGVYIYLDVVLGATDDAVLTWMKDAKNKKTLELIRRDVFPENYMTEKS